MRSHLPALSDFGTAIVFIGVFGELVIASKAGRVETDLRQENDSIISHTRDRAAKAEQAAAEARERSLNIEAENIRLRTELEQAISESRSKQTELEVEQRKTAEAQTRAIKAQEALNRSFTRFAKRSGDRLLDSHKFVDRLKEIPKFNVEIWYRPNDAEAETFSEDIERALRLAQWPVSRREQKAGEALDGFVLARIQGIMWFFQNAEDIEPRRGGNFALALVTSMPFGMTFGSSTVAPELPANTIVVVIGASVKQ
jgi:hypothetical protein